LCVILTLFAVLLLHDDMQNITYTRDVRVDALCKLSTEWCLSVITMYPKYNYAEAENFILWCVHDTWIADGTHHTSTYISKAFASPWHQGLYPGVEEINIKGLYSGGYSLLHVGGLSKEMTITQAP